VDTYFDAEGKKETVIPDQEDSLNAQGVHPDLFTHGKTIADGRFRNPRQYFLVVLRYRIEQVKNEWQQVVEVLKRSIREYEQVRPPSISLWNSLWEVVMFWEIFELK
jgi:hypothetical protein